MEHAMYIYICKMCGYGVWAEAVIISGAAKRSKGRDYWNHFLMDPWINSHRILQLWSLDKAFPNLLKKDWSLWNPRWVTLKSRSNPSVDICSWTAWPILMKLSPNLIVGGMWSCHWRYRSADWFGTMFFKMLSSRHRRWSPEGQKSHHTSNHFISWTPVSCIIKQILWLTVSRRSLFQQNLQKQLLYWFILCILSVNRWRMTLDLRTSLERRTSLHVRSPTFVLRSPTKCRVYTIVV